MVGQTYAQQNISLDFQKQAFSLLLKTSEFWRYGAKRNGKKRIEHEESISVTVFWKANLRLDLEERKYEVDTRFRSVVRNLERIRWNGKRSVLLHNQSLVGTPTRCASCRL